MCVHISTNKIVVCWWLAEVESPNCLQNLPNNFSVSIIFIALRNVELISIQLSAHTLPTPRFILGFLIPMLFFRCFAVKFPFYPIWWVGTSFSSNIILFLSFYSLTSPALHPFHFNQFLLCRIFFYTIRGFFGFCFLFFFSFTSHASLCDHMEIFA